MVSVENMIAGYEGRPVLRDVNFAVAPGEFWGLIGPNGCGKTTLLRALTGILPAMQGTVSVRGQNVRQMGRRKLARVMACLLQDLSLDLAFTVGEVVLMGRSPHLPRIGGETDHDLEVARQAMALCDVSHLADRPITEISGGERQRALIAMCLAQQPEVLLLDEPTNHLDIGHQLAVLDLIARLNGQTGTTVIAVFHDLNLAAEYCQRLLVLDGGRVAARGAPAEVLTAAMISAVYRTEVLVSQNPLTGRPHIVLAAGRNHDRSSAVPTTAADLLSPQPKEGRPS
jgi:iron complex transport system ATP-binding protein